MSHTRIQWIKHIFTKIVQHVLDSSCIPGTVFRPRGNKSKVLLQEAGSLTGKRPVNHLLLYGMSPADTEESPGLWKTTMGIGLNWNSGERISEDSQKKMLAFSPRLKRLGNRHPWFLSYSFHFLILPATSSWFSLEDHLPDFLPSGRTVFRPHTAGWQLA